MQIDSTHTDDGILIVTLAGRMDVAGTQVVDLKFTALTATQKSPIIVDLSQVSFLASLGMRTLIANAKAQSLKGGRMVLLSPQPMVAEALITAGIDTLIPIYDDLASARLALLGAGGA